MLPSNVNEYVPGFRSSFTSVSISLPSASKIMSCVKAELLISNFIVVAGLNGLG
ncbi:MAG TPA: hypothetical protein PKC58_17295 [Ignavibacteria bacterium]|nr:hypothetical protein [Ignavibacteria bacterium]